MAKRAAGEGTIRKRTYTNANGKNYKRWFARVTVTWDGKKKTSKDGPMRETQEEAKEDLRRLQKLLAAGNLETRSKQRLSEYLEEWLEPVELTSEGKRRTFLVIHIRKILVGGTQKAPGGRGAHHAAPARPVLSGYTQDEEEPRFGNGCRGHARGSGKA